MKHTWKVAVAAAVLVGSAGIAKADVTLNGQTGLFLNPTAQVAKKNAPEVAVDYQHYSSHVLSGFVPNAKASGNAYGIVGAIHVADKLELSGGYHRGNIDVLKNTPGVTGISPNLWNLGVKYQIFSQAEKQFDLAVGADYSNLGNITIATIGGATLKVTHYDAYVAATKDFKNSSSRAPIQGTIGLRWNHDKDDVSFPGADRSDSKADIFAGVAVPVTRTGEVSLVGEIGSKRANAYNPGVVIIPDVTPYSIGIRYHPKGSAFNVSGGYAQGNLLAGKGLFLQAGYQFGK